MMKLFVWMMMLIMFLFSGFMGTENTPVNIGQNANEVEKQSVEPANTPEPTATAPTASTAEPVVTKAAAPTSTPKPAARTTVAPTNTPKPAATATPSGEGRSTEGDENETSMNTDF